MKTTLYKVNVKYTVLVAADNAAQAEALTRALGHKATNPDFIIANKIRYVEELPLRWKDRIPLSMSEDTRDCSQILHDRETIGISQALLTS